MRWPDRADSQMRVALLALLLAAMAVTGCAAPWQQSSSVQPTPTPQFAGGEPVLPQLQVLYRDAPLPGADISGTEQSWPLAGFDSANTNASPASAPHGVVRWLFQTPGPVLASPVVAAGIALVSGGDGTLYAVDMRSGTLRWRAPLGDTLVAGTPAVADGTVYVAARDHGLEALDLVTGGPIWTVDTRAPVRAPPLADGSLLFVEAGANTLLCLDRRTGAEYWQFKSEDALANFWPTQGQPAVTSADGGLVFVALGASTELNALSLRTGRKVWEQTVESRMVGAPVFDDQLGLVAVATWSGQLDVMDAQTGTARWHVDIPGAGTIGAGLSAGSALGGDTFFLADYAGDVLALDAHSGARKWTYHGVGAIVVTPIVRLANGAAAEVYIADQRGNLVALNGATGAQEWRIYLGELRAAPVLAAGGLFVGSAGDHGLFALR